MQRRQHLLEVHQRQLAPESNKQKALFTSCYESRLSYLSRDNKVETHAAYRHGIHHLDHPGSSDNLPRRPDVCREPRRASQELSPARDLGAVQIRRTVRPPYKLHTGSIPAERGNPGMSNKHARNHPRPRTRIRNGRSSESTAMVTPRSTEHHPTPNQTQRFPRPGPTK